MTSRRIDQLLSLVGAVLILMSSYQLFFSRTGNYEGATLGRVAALEKVVKVKRARALDWVDAFTDDLITENQMIYTDDLSRAEVTFTEGQKLIINQNSLVKIRSRGKENELDVDKGTIRATLKGDETFIVKLNGEDYALKGDGADVEINLHGNVGEIGVVSGDVRLEKDGKTTALDQKTALVVEGENYSTRAIIYNLNQPARQALLYTGAEMSEVQFSWTGEASGTIMIATNPGFTGAITGVSEDGKFSRALPAGHYFWKLEGKEGQSLTSEFRLIQETPPEILRPRDGATVDVLLDENKAGVLRLEWDAESSTGYEIEITGETETIRQKTEVPFFDFRPSGPQISWKARALRPDAVWTAPQKVSLSYHLFPIMPANLYPDGVEYQTFSGKAEQVELSWSVSGRTEIELDGKTLTTDTPSYSFDASPGKHRWRARSVDAFERSSPWSDWKEFTVADMSGEKNAEGFQRIQLKRPDQEVTFAWEEGSGSNVFELASDRNFEKIVTKKEVSGSETKVSVPKTGTYFWRSREFRKDGTLHVSEPKKVIIEPLPAPVKPEALPPMEVPLERSEATTTFIDRFISSAFADDVFGNARINLPAKENVKFYVLRIFRKNERTPLFEDKLDRPSFLWKNALPGEYEFQYAVVDFFGRQSPFSDLSRLTVREPGGPARPLLISPIRLEAVEGKIDFRWGHADRAEKYLVSVFRDEFLKDKLKEKEVTAPHFTLQPEDLPEGTYYWQVQAVDVRGETTLSSVGRFVYRPVKEEVIAVPVPGIWQKTWKNRAQVTWAPSSDSYSFKEDEVSGKIDGNALMGLEGRAVIFGPKWNFTGELLRQQGKVFKKEAYSFTKIAIDAGWILERGQHVFSAGPTLGFGMGQAYSISDSTVTAGGISGAIYGGTLRSFHSFSGPWEAEGKLSYLLGAFNEMEFSGNVLKNLRSFYLVFGAGVVRREYNKNDGEQSSLKLNAGIGREF